MTDPATKKVDPSSALAVAILFAVHAFFVALSSASHAAPARLDAFGNSLCIGSLAYNGSDREPSDRHPPSDCCSFGCHSGCSASAGLLVRIPLLLEGSQWPAAYSYAIPASRPLIGVERSSIRSRGPPRPA